MVIGSKDISCWFMKNDTWLVFVDRVWVMTPVDVLSCYLSIASILAPVDVYMSQYFPWGQQQKPLKKHVSTGSTWSHFVHPDKKLISPNGKCFVALCFQGRVFEIVSLNTRRLQRSSIFYTYIFTIAHDITQYLHIETEREKENKNKDLHHFNPPPPPFCIWFSHARRSNPPSFVIYQPHWPHWCSTGCGQGSELLKWERVIFRFGIVISSSLFWVDDFRIL